MIGKIVAKTDIPFSLHGIMQALVNGFQKSYMDKFYQSLSQVRMWALSDNQDGHQNGHHISVCICGPS